jgi:hypothetical protein
VSIRARALSRPAASVRERTIFVCAGEPAVPDHIRRQDRRNLPNLGHRAFLPFMNGTTSGPDASGPLTLDVLCCSPPTEVGSIGIITNELG